VRNNREINVTGDNHHMKKNNIILLVLITISFFMECVSIYILFSSYPDYSFSTISEIIITHLAATFLAARTGVAYLSTKKKFFSLILVFLFTVPLLGYIGILQLFLARKAKEAVLIYKEYREHILSGSEKNENRLKLKDSYEYMRKSFEIESVYDTIKGDGGLEKKLDIIKNLGRIKNKASIKALKILMADPHMDVRYYAGEELSKIADEYNIFINEIKTDTLRVSHNDKLYLELGSLIIDYVFSGIFQRDEMKKELEEAERALKKSLELNPTQFEANFLLGYIYVFYKEYDKARGFYNDALNIRKMQESDIDELPVLLGLAECYWQKKDIAQVDNYIKEIRERLSDYSGDDKEVIREFIYNWSGDNGNHFEECRKPG